LAPWLQHKATVNKALAISGGQALLTRQGVWLKDNSNFIHIQKVLSGGHLQEITRYSFDENNKLTSLEFAAEANYQHGQWTCNKVVTTNIEDGATSSAQFDTQPCAMKFKPRLLSLTASDSEQKTLLELRRYIKYLHQGGLDSSSYEFTFWQRVFQPLAIVVMIMLAVPFIFGPLRSATMGLRMLAAIVIGFTFYIFNQFIGPFSVVYQMPPLLAALSPTLLFSLFGWLLLRRL
jgi:lipopolysaccharide export system permease protein